MRFVSGFAIVWKFTVRPESQRRFETLYGPNGKWAVLFARGAGYRGTELLRSTTEPQTYFTIDRWETEHAFEEFRNRFASEYTQLDQECDGLADSELHLGSFVRWD